MLGDGQRNTSVSDSFGVIEYDCGQQRLWYFVMKEVERSFVFQPRRSMIPYLCHIFHHLISKATD